MDEKNKNKTKTDEQLSPETVIKIREIHPKRWGRLWWEGFMEKVSFESGVEQRWSDA